MTVQNSFAVVEVENPNIHLSTFATGAEAGKVAADLNSTARANNLSSRFRVVALKPAANDDGSWKDREIILFKYGIYKPVPWANEPWANPDHFAHVSKNNPTKLAFTPNFEFGLADRQLRMRPGRYLTKYFSSILTPDEIKLWCSKYTLENGSPKLHFATTPDEIQAVYENGPNSCMGHKAADYDSSQHPTRVYGAGDLAIAWVPSTNDENEDSDEDAAPHVAARALCWPVKKIFTRIYGDETLLTQLLTDAGFRESFDSSDWNGARLLRIEDEYNDSLIVPYLDEPNHSVSEKRGFLVINSCGDIQCRETNGLAEPSELCARCEERTSDETYTVDGETWCEHCYENHSFHCEGCLENCGGEPDLHDRNNNAICESCASFYGQCESCSEWFYTGDAGSDLTYSEADHADYCSYCANDMKRTSCGEPTRNPGSCSCIVCKAAQFELETQTQTGEPAPFSPFIPVILKPTCPTIRDARQGELPHMYSFFYQ